MQFYRETGDGVSLIEAYEGAKPGAGNCVIYGGKRCYGSVLLGPGTASRAWGPANFLALQAEHAHELSLILCDVLLLGTGQHHQFPSGHLLKIMTKNFSRAVDVMSTSAACRTFNIIAAEGRTVAAALILET